MRACLSLSMCISPHFLPSPTPIFQPAFEQFAECADLAVAPEGSVNTTLLGGFNTPNATLGSADSDKTVIALGGRNSIVKGGVVSNNNLISEVR